jgi:IS5 family transposase
VQTVKVTAANVSDVATMPELLTGEEEVVNGDSGYLGAQKREDAVLKNKQGKKIRYKINRRPSQIKNRSLWSQGSSSAGSAKSHPFV